MQYLISANPGEPLGPVDEIASGGELSRVMLALKTSDRKQRREATKPVADLRSGKVGRERLAADPGLRRNRCRHRRARRRAVGKKLKQLSRTKQVLCITHLPQIASFADHTTSSRSAKPAAGPRPRCGRLTRGTHARDRAHDQRREAHRNLAEARRADAEGESLEARLPVAVVIA